MSVFGWKEEVSLPDFSMSSLGHLMPSLFWLYVQHLARDVTEVVEFREEVTWARAATIMAENCAAQAEMMAQERAILLASR
jgi:hypothetical protein